MGLIVFFSDGKGILAPEGFDGIVGQNGKLLVRGGIVAEGNAFVAEGPADSQGLLHGVPGNLLIEAVCEQGFKLNTQQPPFGEHAAALLDMVAEVFLQLFVHDHHSFAEKRSNLGAPDIKHIAEPGHIRQAEIGTRRGQTVAKARPIQQERQSQLAASSAGKCRPAPAGPYVRGLYRSSARCIRS